MTPKFALILSGGAARGAYETGVLKYLAQESLIPNFNIVCGTSVGAIHACFLAARLNENDYGLDRLESIWTNLNPGSVINFNWNSFRNLFPGGKSYGLVGVDPLKKLLIKEGKWKSITKNIKNKNLETLCISTTSASTGQTIVWTETDEPIPNNVSHIQFKKTNININHALASSSIPILFPPVMIDDEWFTDGGVRQNTPIAPALAFGATHIFSIGLWHDHGKKQKPNQSVPTVGHILGKIFNSFFLDHAHADLNNLNHINNIISFGIEKYGQEFVTALNKEKNYRLINNFFISPSQDIGSIASQYLSTVSLRKDAVYKSILKLADTGTDEADLASYLMFDGEFASKLIDLGYRDAEAKKQQIINFFKSK